MPGWVVTGLDIVGRCIVIYVVVLVGLRVSGKREIGQMTVFDLVVLLLLANAVQNAMVGPDTSLWGGVVAAVVLLGLNAGVAKLRLTSPRLRKMIEGSPTVLILHGQVVAEQMRREGLDEETLQAAVREHGIAELAGVEMAVLETDGSISVVPTGGGTKRIKRPARYIKRS